MKQTKPEIQVNISKVAYQAPAIIYESSITTRAGSPFFTSDEDEGVDPADLFGN